jgi:hypothetical protein
VGVGLVESDTSKKESWRITSRLMSFVHSKTCGRTQTKKAADFQRPSSMMRSVEWFIRNRAIAAPDRRDFVLMSEAEQPKVFFPLRAVQVTRRRSHRNSCDIASAVPESKMVLKAVDARQPGTSCGMRDTRDAVLRTGQSMGSSVRRCARVLFFSLFF